MSLYLEFPEWDLPFSFRTFENVGETIVSPHWHKEIEMIYVTKGSVNIGHDDQLIQVHEGEVFIFGSGEPHYFLASPGSVRIVYQFDLGLFRDVFIKETEQKELLKTFERIHNHSKHWPSSVVSCIVQHLEILYEEAHYQPKGFEYAIFGELYQLVACFYREVPKKEGTVMNKDFVAAIKNNETLERLNAIFIFIEENYNEGITLDSVARFSGFSPYYFSRFFKKNTGQTFMQFLTEYRINQAKYILAHESLPMIEVAEKSGFNSVKTFHHVFKEYVGMSPLKYQKTKFGNN